VKELLSFDPKAYGPVFEELLEGERLNLLGPGSPNAKAKSALSALAVERAFYPHKIVDLNMAKACLSAIWLRHDYLDESHRISQSIDTPTGSYWHGIMHRREGDFSNSKGWFRKVGEHPVFEPLRAAASNLSSASNFHESAAFLVNQPKWEPFRFIDLCEACIKGSSPAETLCRQVQKGEWELLFDYCYHQAVGR
jgi:hypothetical protein